MTPQDELAALEREQAAEQFCVDLLKADSNPRFLDHVTPIGELGVHNWVAAITYAFSKSLPWHFDLQAFRLAMVHTAAICLRAALWTEQVMRERRQVIEEIRARNDDSTTDTTHAAGTADVAQAAQ